MTVPRADRLAIVTAEQPVANATAQVRRNRFSEFDREITNASPSVQDVGEATPFAPVVTGVVGATVPPPPVTWNVTEWPWIGFPN